MIFQESLEVAVASVELPLGQADDQRLGEFEEAAAFSLAVDRQLGACAVWLKPLVDFEEVRPSGGRGDQSRKGTGTKNASKGSRTRCGQATPICPRFCQRN